MNLCQKDIIPTRAVCGLMIFTACFVSYMLRVNMSINIIAMSERPTASHSKNVTKAECLVNNAANNSMINSNETLSELVSLPDYGDRYEWDPHTQGLILGSYFWGYMFTSVPGGFLAERFGPTKVIIVSQVISAAGTLLTPLAASWNYVVVIVVRILLGLMGGMVYPALHCLVSRWAPPEEKGKFIGALLGGTLGIVLTWPLLGAIIEAWGWKWAFYIPGGVTLIWCCFWVALVTDTPDSHPRISEDEKIYILKSIGDNVGKKKAIPPYCRMFASIPFWALTILHFGSLWGLSLLQTAGPKFMSEVLGFNLGHSGILAALPYLARMIFGCVFGYVGDIIRKNKWMSTTKIRKSFIISSHMLPGLLLFGLILVGCDPVLCVSLITLSMGLNGASTLTNLQNNQDLAPNFAGTIYGLINCFASTTGFFTPMITGYLTFEHNGLYEWHTIFSIGASVYIATGIVFCIFGSGEQQPWNQVCINVTEGVENPAFDKSQELVSSSNMTINDNIIENSKI